MNRALPTGGVHNASLGETAWESPEAKVGIQRRGVEVKAIF